MEVLSKALFRGAATTTVDTLLYTVPSATTTIVTDIIVVNTTGVVGTFSLALADVSLATTVMVAANDSTVIPIKQSLSPGQTLKGGASATTINFHISGVEAT